MQQIVKVSIKKLLLTSSSFIDNDLAIEEVDPKVKEIQPELLVSRHTI